MGFRVGSSTDGFSHLLTKKNDLVFYHIPKTCKCFCIDENEFRMSVCCASSVSGSVNLSDKSWCQSSRRGLYQGSTLVLEGQRPNKILIDVQNSMTGMIRLLAIQEQSVSIRQRGIKKLPQPSQSLSKMETRYSKG
ncbi:hypothetical protein CEXT_267311 [Caerostris extrusa]|uniref:Uncharacterized protein n=1 Tax=Caerostris extrusa TaxID=172846 RepID=A0AAV4R252_CAEEX|nr:hypothetical protein CEXT_267311 [Caerostris extrusa]